SKVKLVVLDACQSAMSSADDAFSSVAARLIQGGVDATIAMSASVLVVTSTLFFARFYHELANGTPAPLAQERARQTLHDEPRRYLLRRHRDEEGQSVELCDWWLPHFYQQRPFTLQATRSAHKFKLPKPGTILARSNETMPPEPRYGFIGRARELLQIERHLLRKRLVVVSGFGGVGKTALVREAANWLTRTGMYAGACFVSFEHGGDAALLLSVLGTCLGVNDSHYNPNDPAVALARLKSALSAHPCLVVADNLESVLPKGDAPLEDVTRKQLWSVLLDLAKLQAGVLLTTRDTAFGDTRIAPGAQVASFPLVGLLPDDAYALATQLLENLDIDRARVPYADLRDLLTMLDHHPLAIQLVLPTLQTLPLTTIRANFALLLAHFTDDYETGRNRSLLASLDYSIQRLSVVERTLLPRLAIFEGGASEDSLLTITDISLDGWTTLRQALEQAGLLTVETVEESFVPFLRFHPLLTPYLRSQHGGDDAALREHYAQCYADCAISFYHEYGQYPQKVRTLVQKELPNLRKALEVLLATGKMEASASMAESLSMFLGAFGLRRERDELRQRVGKALATQRATEHGIVTYAEYLHESGLAEDELNRGNKYAAYDQLTHLLARIETLPEGTPLGYGSHEHCTTLLSLSRCLQPVEAETCLRRALQIVDLLIKQNPEKKSSINLRGAVLAYLVTPLFSQGKYAQARDVSEQALEVAKQLGDRRNLAEMNVRLAVLALYRPDYAEAKSRFAAAVQDFRMLCMPAREAEMWLGLGGVAERQEDWIKAEHCYRQGLAIHELLGDAYQASAACNYLASIARIMGRAGEAEGWYKRALELDKLASPDSPDTSSL
ncbi:MAG TPA: tetratricopeptide repeat protein, partial [Ktedonobacteraceae bacterium]|nr:tetratricopeptide repeat protein [Ktedonobacteraceae bacterium]